MRPDNSAPIIAAAHRRHELTRAKAVRALRELERGGAALSFAAVAHTAGVSRSWLYAQADLRQEITRHAGDHPAGSHTAHPRDPARLGCLAAPAPSTRRATYPGHCALTTRSYAGNSPTPWETKRHAGRSSPPSR